MLRVMAAFLVAPIVAWIGRLFLSEDSLPVHYSEFAEAVCRAALPVYVFALPMGLLFFGVAWRIGRVSLLFAALAGALAPFLMFGGMAFNVLGDQQINDWYQSKLMAAALYETLFGAWVGIVAWGLGVWRNPTFWKKVQPQLGGVKNAL